MTRQLSAEEEALWRRVAADVKSSKTQSGSRLKKLNINDFELVPETRPQRAIRTTLDHRWDQRLRDGEVRPDRVIDLHGCTLDTAHGRVIDALAHGTRDGSRVLVFITGKAPAKGVGRLDSPLRGIIRASISDWIGVSGFAADVAAIRPASRRHGGDGAIYVVLRRKKRTAA